MATDNAPKYDAGAKYEEAIWPEIESRAPASAAEVVQRRANKANHSERVRNNGNPGAGEKVR